MNKIINLSNLKKYKKLKPKSIEEIFRMNKKIKNDIEFLMSK